MTMTAKQRLRSTSESCWRNAIGQKQTSSFLPLSGHEITNLADIYAALSRLYLMRTFEDAKDFH
jgi:hypothetical protein